MKQYIFKSMTINERIEMIKKSQLETNSDFNDFEELQKWLNRKTTINYTSFQKILSLNDWTSNLFNVSLDYSKFIEQLKGNSSVDTNLLNLFEETLRYIDNSEFNNSYAYLLRPFFSIFHNKFDLEKFNYRIKDEVQKNIMECLYERLLNLGIKTFILDLHELKEKNKLNGETSEERFQDYLEIAGEKEYLSSLYIKYPVLLRKLMKCTNDFANFCNEIFSRIEKNKNNFSTLFRSSKQSELVLNKAVFENGDTHENGRTVVVLDFNQGKLLYKPRNLYIENEFRKILNFFENKESILEMKMPRAIYFKEYCFTEYIEQSKCNTIEEVKNYFVRYGQLIGIMYLVNGSDMHFENIISQGEFPIIVDYETLFSTSVDYEGGDSIFSSVTKKIRNSVSGSIMLPANFVLDYEGNSVDISGLDGREQKLSKKSYIPKDITTDEARFELDNIVIQAAKNLVHYDDRIVDYKYFSDDIVFGLKSILNSFLKYKKEYINLIESLNSSIIRIIVRNTNNYAQFLEFTKHPSCMTDFVEVEKILENLYTFPLENKEVIKLEYQEMLFDDIPIFFTQLDSQDLYSSDGSVVNNLFKLTPRQELLNKLKKIDKFEVKKQIGICNMQLLQGEGFTSTVITPSSVDTPLQLASLIADQIVDSAIIDEENKLITWISFKSGMNKDYEFGMSNINYYDGILGIARFLKEIGRVTNNEKYNNYANYAINTAFNLVDFSSKDSAFVGAHSLLQLFPYITTKDFCYSRKAIYMGQLDEAFPTFIENICSNDWLMGASGVAGAYVDCLKNHQDESYLDKALFLGNRVISQTNKSFDNWGIGHGISGNILMALKINDVVHDEMFYGYLKETTNIFSSKIDNDFKHINSWCNGSIGFMLVKALLWKEGYLREYPSDIDELITSVSSEEFNSDCVCHGRAGLINALYDLESITGKPKYGLLADKMINEILDKLNRNGTLGIETFEGFINLSLFKGLPGLGYTLLRYEDRRVPSLLL